MGVMEDKVIKNHYASEYIYHAYRNTKTVGVLEEDPAFGIKKIAEPIGLVAAVIPTTNPTSTAIFKALLCLKTRNAILISPHPRAKKCTAEAAREGGYDYFATTLTVSPHKNAPLINAIGEKLAEEHGVLWLPSNFKKRDGYRRSIELSHEYGLYRQSWCGCGLPENF